MWIKGNRDAINTDYMVSLSVRALDGYSDKGTLTATTSDGAVCVLTAEIDLGYAEALVEGYFQALAEGWPIYDVSDKLMDFQTEEQFDE